jgi:tetratricopeptide (TPR) repeat protein
MMNHLIMIHCVQNRLQEAAELQKETLRLRKLSYYPSDYPVVVRSTMGNLGQIYQDQGRLDEAIDLLEAAVAISRST